MLAAYLFLRVAQNIAMINILYTTTKYLPFLDHVIIIELKEKQCNISVLLHIPKDYLTFSTHTEN